MTTWGYRNWGVLGVAQLEPVFSYRGRGKVRWVLEASGWTFLPMCAIITVNDDRRKR